MISGPHYSQRAFNADAESTAQGLWTLSWEVFLYRNISARQEHTISKSLSLGRWKVNSVDWL